MLVTFLKKVNASIIGVKQIKPFANRDLYIYINTQYMSLIQQKFRDCDVVWTISKGLSEKFKNWKTVLVELLEKAITV